MIAYAESLGIALMCECPDMMCLAVWSESCWCDENDMEIEARGLECPACGVTTIVPSITTVRIFDGQLPYCLEGEDWRLYRGAYAMASVDWCNWCRMWLGIAWVRKQGFDRDCDSEDFFIP